MWDAFLQLPGREKSSRLVKVHICMPVGPACAKSFVRMGRGAARAVLIPPAAVGCSQYFPEVSMAPWSSFPAARQEAQLEGVLMGCPWCLKGLPGLEPGLEPHLGS